MSGTHLIAYYSSIQCCTLVQGLDPGSSRPIEQVWHMGCKHLVRRRLRSLNPKQKPSETSPSSYQYIATFSTCGYVWISERKGGNAQVNGVPVKNLKDLVAAVEACQTPFIRMDLDYNQVLASLRTAPWLFLFNWWMNRQFIQLNIALLRLCLRLLWPPHW